MFFSFVEQNLSFEINILKKKKITSTGIVYILGDVFCNVRKGEEIQMTTRKRGRQADSMSSLPNR